VAAHKKFPTAVDLRKADHRIWEELSPAETLELLEKAYNNLTNNEKLYRIAFSYWLYWLQAVRFRVINDVLVQLMITQEPICRLTTNRLSISRLKAGRLGLSWAKMRAFYKLYLLSADERRELKQEVLNSNG
jgi:hypothetical protein